MLVRGTRSGRELSALVQRAVTEVYPGQHAGDPLTIGELIGRDSARHRFNMVLLLWFGVCAAILAIAAIYGVIVKTIAARGIEFAIKSALGDTRHRLVRDLAVRAVRYAGLGVALGTATVAVFGTLGTDVLHGTSARDPVVLSSVAASLFLECVGAAF